MDLRIMTRPLNILLILTDQQNADSLSCGGNPNVQTPNLNSLASRGVRFENAYCTNPRCSPSRKSMLSGQMPSRLGTVDNRTGDLTPWRDEVRSATIGWLLRNAGYACFYGGKWNAGGGISLPDPNVLDFGFKRLHGFDDFGLADACIDFLSSNPIQPFLLMASFDNPHNICEAGSDRPLPWGEIADAPLAQYPNLPPNFQPSPYEPQAIEDRRANLGDLMAMKYSFDRWRKYRHDYYRLVEKADGEIGRILCALKGSALLTNTVVIFTSDHGEMNAAHRLGHKQVLYEESIGVPLIISDPQGEQRGTVVSDLVSTGLDLVPTICDFAGLNIPQNLRGRSLRSRILGNSDSSDDCDRLHKGHSYLIAETRHGSSFLDFRHRRAPCVPGHHRTRACRRAAVVARYGT